VKQYELVVLLHPDLEIDADAPISKIEKLITGVKGKITKRDNWGKKRLAYPIKKQQFGLYVYFELDLEPEAIRQLESSLLITEEIIRFMLVGKVVVQKHPIPPSDKADKSEVTTAAVATSEEK
jgi:small subunit ribosomal protein S6